MAILDRVHEYSGLLRGLRAYFEHPPTLEEAKATIREHIERREDLFLTMARERFCVPGSPYQPLFELAQCAYRDVEVMVRQHGVEGTLDALRRAGVYLSFEEFKFGGEVRREGRVFQMDPAQFNAGQGTSLLSVRSGATRSAGTWSPRSIEHFASRAPQLAVTLALYDDGGAPILCWLSGFPAGAGIFTWFVLAKLHRPALRWFSLTPMPRGMRGRHELILRTVLAVAKRASLRLPSPEYTPVGEVGKVLDVVLKTLATSGRCLMMTPTSCAVRLSAEAYRRGASLRGVQFITNGEPLTPGKAEEIRRAGAGVGSRYSMSEVGPVGMPCGAPIEPDDMHFLSTMLAMILSRRQLGDLTVDALMLTSLLPTTPKLLLNVEVDDFATVDERRCGCLWDELGCRTHLARVRSFTKLTGEGTTILGSNCVHILEHVLPEAFGGSSVDYQLVEAEDQAHLTRLYLLISPRVGPLNDDAVLRRFGEALQATERRPMGGKRPIWDEAHTVRVIRREPVATRAGKLLPFHTIGAAASMEFRIDPAG